jgi:hypothetical protein
MIILSPLWSCDPLFGLFLVHTGIHKFLNILDFYWASDNFLRTSKIFNNLIISVHFS